MNVTELKLACPVPTELLLEVESWSIVEIEEQGGVFIIKIQVNNHSEQATTASMPEPTQAANHIRPYRFKVNRLVVLNILRAKLDKIEDSYGDQPITNNQADLLGTLKAGRVCLIERQSAVDQIEAERLFVLRLSSKSEEGVRLKNCDIPLQPLTLSARD